MKQTQKIRQKQNGHKISTQSADIILHPKYRDTLDTLLKEQKDILGQIEKERQKLSRFVAASSHIGGVLSARLQPIMKEIQRARNQASQLARVLLNERRTIPQDILEPLIGLAHIQDIDETDDSSDEFEKVPRDSEQGPDANSDSGAVDEEGDSIDEEELSDHEMATKQRNPTLRGLYLELSRAFHPDKAANDEERERFHLYMRDINTWYKAGDMSSLIQFSLTVKEDMPSTFLSSDVLSQEEERLRRHIVNLKGELRILKTEYRHLRKMVPEPKLVDKVVKGKANLEKEVEKELEEVQDQLKKYFKLRDTLALVVRRKRPITALESVFDLFSYYEADEDDSKEDLDISDGLAAMMQILQREFDRRR